MNELMLSLLKQDIQEIKRDVKEIKTMLRDVKVPKELDAALTKALMHKKGVTKDESN